MCCLVSASKMAESLRRLVNIGSYSILQEKLERWLEDYNVNTCEQNASRCCEVIELTSRVQAQLFKLLSMTAAEGGTYGAASVIRSRLLPWLGSGIFGPPGLSMDTNLSLIAESAAKDREITDIQDMYERNLHSLEQDLTDTRVEADQLKAELDETKDELESSKRLTASDKMFSESEVRELKTKLRLANDEIATLRGRVGLVDSYERQVTNLREDLAILTGRKEVLLNGDADLYKPRLTPLPRPISPLASDDVTQRVRQQNLITRFNDMFAADRLDAMDTLRRYCDDYENNQRIVFAIIVEAYNYAKQAFSSWKLKIRSNLAGTHLGPETLEEAVQDYINRNTDLYDLPAIVSDVIRALNRNPRFYLPVEVNYSILQSFIREACKLAWNMSALAYPLAIALASDAELFDDGKYRRSYDSEYTAPLVNHHIWPCLMQGARVIMKGEACTKRGASLIGGRSRSPMRSVTPSRSRSRSASPMRSLSRARSRSPSPRRLESSLSGRASPGFRSPSRTSSIPSRAVTASTSLSHYGVKS